MNPTTTAAVAESLNAVLAATDNASRANAESMLVALSQQQGYPECLADIAMNQNAPVHLRQSAGVNLKNYIDKHWSSRELGFVGPEPSVQAKAFVKAAVLAGLSDSQSRIRVLMAATATKIVNIEDLESWPELFTSLMSNLKSGSPDQIHGALRVISSFVDDISETQFSQIAPVLLPQVFEIFANKGFNPRVRSRAISVFRKFLETLHNVERLNPTVVKQYLEPQLLAWMQLIQQILAPMDMSNEQIIFKTEIFYTLEYLVTKFPAAMKPYFSESFQLVWRTATALYPIFKATIITTTDGVDAVEEVDTDGDVMGINSLLFNVFAILGVGAESKHMDGVFAGEGGSASAFIKELVEVGVSYAQISDGQIESWESDLNTFIQEEEETAPSFTMRYAVTMLFDQLTARHSARFIQSLLGAVMVLFANAKKAREQGDANWWRILESCIYCMCTSQEAIIEAVKSGKVSFDFDGFFGHVIQDCIKCAACPILQSRALVFTSIFSAFIPTEQMPQYINAMATSLTSNFALPCRIGAVRSLMKLAAKPEMVPHFSQSIGSILENVCAMIPSATEDLLLLLLESLLPLVKIDEVLVTKFEANLIPLLVSVWTRDPDDNLVNVCVMNVFTVLSKNKLMFEALQNRLLPPLCTSISDASLMANQPGVYGSALMLLGVLIRGSSAPLPAPYMTTVFPPLIQAMLHSEDNSILQEGQDCLQSIILKDMSAVVQWTDGTKNGLGYVLDVIARLLNPQSDQSSCLFLGSLVTSVIQKGGESVTPILPNLLTAIVHRLSTATYTQLIETLLLVFANLILQHGSPTIITFLSGMTTPEGNNGLELFLRMWSENYFECMGFYNVKLNAAALTRLMMESGNDERVQRVLVKGHLKPTSVIVTRSRSKNAPDQYEMIPFPAKAIMLILADYQQNRESAMKGDKGGVDELTGDTIDTEEDSGDWDDLEEQGFDDFGFGNGDWADNNDEAEETTDPELINKEVYDLNMTEYLGTFVKHYASNSRDTFNVIANQMLDNGEKKILASIMA
ncbi:ARM repeat-containing protein [Rhizoclosmatium globosum]|uniref:ARM repeat-containing protein n=1 Tax=Rhizoclosmatium globosum TaxID=329046 RepID=A0A1Y2D309_9FUNG|nr:ARM repeat-containing protein [Rhizoclosmatium globosum]|eukprot:ORY53662.1 ARM repeat-containing protein [Rhizoclosmatium globosum]